MQKSMHRAEITCFIVQRPVLKRGQFVLESGISESFAQRFDSFRFTMYYEGLSFPWYIPQSSRMRKPSSMVMRCLLPVTSCAAPIQTACRALHAEQSSVAQRSRCL